MPVPTPNAGESRKDFVSRCIGDLTKADPMRAPDQIDAMCFTAWNDAKEAAAKDASSPGSRGSDGEIANSDDGPASVSKITSMGCVPGMPAMLSEGGGFGAKDVTPEAIMWPNYPSVEDWPGAGGEMGESAFQGDTPRADMVDPGSREDVGAKEATIDAALKKVPTAGMVGYQRTGGLGG